MSKPSWMSSTRPSQARRATPPPRKSRDIKMTSVTSKSPQAKKDQDDDDNEVFTMKSIANESHTRTGTYEQWINQQIRESGVSGIEPASSIKKVIQAARLLDRLQFDVINSDDAWMSLSKRLEAWNRLKNLANAAGVISDPPVINESTLRIYIRSLIESSGDEFGIACNNCGREGPGDGHEADASAAGWVDQGHAPDWPLWTCPRCLPQKTSARDVSLSRPDALINNRLGKNRFESDPELEDDSYPGDLYHGIRGYRRNYDED